MHPQGCPPEQVKGVLARLPAVSQKFAKYWICKARLMEQEGNLDVLPMFEEAVRIVLEVRCLGCYIICSIHSVERSIIQFNNKPVLLLETNLHL